MIPDEIAGIIKYVTTKHSKGNNHIARPHDDSKTLCGKPVTGEGVEGAGVCGNCKRLADLRKMVEASAPIAAKPADDMTADAAKWIRENVWTPAMRKQFRDTPMAASSCACQYGDSQHCTNGNCGMCHVAEGLPTCETYITRANATVVNFDKTANPAQVWLADRVCRWKCEHECHAAPAVETPEPVAADVIATREAWLLKAVEYFRPRFAEIGHPLPKRVHVSVGYGSDGRGTENATILGVCFARWVSVDGVNHIYISPEIADTARVLDVLVHELCHAADDCQSGHKGAFAEAATALGLVGPMTSTVAGEELALELKKLAVELGEYPHGQLRPRSYTPPAPAPAAPGLPTPEMPAPRTGGARRPSSGPKPQTNRHVLLKCEAEGCACEGYQVRTSRKWIEKGLPFCPCGNEMTPQN